ncbi:hypothetical protein JL721_9559 [Aureococcus anophagefferens]|nr:hypothetical protein JL721_9559 [Aureococcus anophagefferens]
MDVTDVDLEYGAAATPVDAAKPENDYAQHFDADVVIPDRIARPVVASARCFLALALVSFLRGYDVLAAVALGLYGTSVNHWRRLRGTAGATPRTCSPSRRRPRRSYLAAARARSPAWWASLAAVAAAFAYNETALRGATAPSSFSRPPRRATWTHVACVHGGAAALAFVFVLCGLDDP